MAAPALGFPAASMRRAPVPGGGSVGLPRAYDPVLDGDYRSRDTGALIAYRHYRSMLSGTSECDGMIAVARAGAHESLDAFVAAARGALTTRWAYADESQARWYGKDEGRFPVERRASELGVELSGPLKVHVVGFFDVYDKPARFYAVDHTVGIRIAVWLFDSDGGEARAQKIARAIAQSWLKPQ